MNIADLKKRLAARSLDDVHRESGVSKRTLQRLKAGQPGTFENFVAVSAALDRLERQARTKRTKAAVAA